MALFRKEVELINADCFATDDSKVMTRIGYVEKRESQGVNDNFIGQEYGEAYLLGNLYNDLKESLPLKAILEFGMSKDKNNREKIRLLSVNPMIKKT